MICACGPEGFYGEWELMGVVVLYKKSLVAGPSVFELKIVPTVSSGWVAIISGDKRKWPVFVVSGLNGYIIGYMVHMALRKVC